MNNYPNHHIWASDSSSLVLRDGIADLSRRLPTIQVPFLSFLEYLHLKDSETFEAFQFENLDPEKVSQVLKSSSLLKKFGEYRRAGLRPFFLEGQYDQKVLATLEKSLVHDLPFFTKSSVNSKHLGLARSIVSHLSMSTVPTVNIEKLGSHWNLGKEKVYEVLEILQHVGVINIVYRDGSKEVGKGAKIFLADPSLYHVLNTRNLGTEREAFFVMNVRALGKKVYAAKNETQADFIVDGISYEVGGQSKKRKRADFVVRDGDDVPTRTSIPMWCLAFGY